MNKLYFLRMCCGVVAALPVSLCAAPLDALLTADEYHHKGEYRAEAAYDAVNSKLDVLKIRANDPIYAGTNSGDYSGMHVRLGYALTDSWVLEGAWWKRNITYGVDSEALNTTQIATQFNLLGNENSNSHLALRLGTWGNQSPSMTKSTATTVSGYSANSVTINSLSDSQQQVDLIATWRLFSQTSLSMFASTGKSQVSTGNISANYTSSNGCNYNLMFTASGTSGALARPCSSSGAVIDSFSTTQSALQDFSYTAKYYQYGGMLQWRDSDWLLRGGYQFQQLNRDTVDALIVSGGGVPYQTNHTVVAEAMYRLYDDVSLLVRGQMMSNQFVGDIPFAYNNVTASKFGMRYGFATFGLTMGF